MSASKVSTDPNAVRSFAARCGHASRPLREFNVAYARTMLSFKVRVRRFGPSHGAFAPETDGSLNQRLARLCAERVIQMLKGCARVFWNVRISQSAPNLTRT